MPWNIEIQSIEACLDNVGYAIDSNVIWGVYIDFVKRWPEGGATDTGKKLAAL